MTSSHGTTQHDDNSAESGARAPKRNWRATSACCKSAPRATGGGGQVSAVTLKPAERLLSLRLADARPKKGPSNLAPGRAGGACARLAWPARARFLPASARARGRRCHEQRRLRNCSFVSAAR